MLTIETRKTRHIVGIAALALIGATYLTAPIFPLAGRILFSLGGFVLALIWMRAYWRDIGEVARDAQKTAWLWGGVIGGGIALVGMMAPLLAPLYEPLTGPLGIAPGTHSLAFLAGAVTFFFAQTAGFLVYWAWWWAARK